MIRPLFGLIPNASPWRVTATIIFCRLASSSAIERSLASTAVISGWGLSAEMMKPGRS